MNVTLYTCYSEKNKLNKTMTEGDLFTGTLKDVSSILDPEILIETDNPSAYNYARIPLFDRFYFITDITSIRSGLWLIKMHVDVLSSFKTYIRNVPVIISDTEDNGKDLYLSGNVWKSKVKELTNILNFSNGLLTDGEFILITAGG